MLGGKIRAFDAVTDDVALPFLPVLSVRVSITMTRHVRALVQEQEH